MKVIDLFPWRIILLVGFCALGGLGARADETSVVVPDEVPEGNLGLLERMILRFPQVSLRQVQTHTIQVRKLPANVYPVVTSMVMEIPAEEKSSRSQPWRGARWELEIKTVAGQVLHQRTVDLATAPISNALPSLSGEPAKIVVALPQAVTQELSAKILREYDIVVRVLVPSARATDSFTFPEMFVGYRRVVLAGARDFIETGLGEGTEPEVKPAGTVPEAEVRLYRKFGLKILIHFKNDRSQRATVCKEDGSGFTEEEIKRLLNFEVTNWEEQKIPGRRVWRQQRMAKTASRWGDYAAVSGDGKTLELVESPYFRDLGEQSWLELMER